MLKPILAILIFLLLQAAGIFQAGDPKGAAQAPFENSPHLPDKLKFADWIPINTKAARACA